MENINIFIQNIINYDYFDFFSKIINSLSFELLLKIIVIYFFIVWIAIIIWVTKDIINRTNNILLQTFSILTVLFWTPLWIVIYLLIRPSKTLFEQYYDEVDIEQLQELDLEENKEIKPPLNLEEKTQCHNCGYSISNEYKYCPNCRICLKKECLNCKKTISPEWTICPFCWKDQEEKINAILEEEKKEIKKEEIKNTKN